MNLRNPPRPPSGRTAASAGRSRSDLFPLTTTCRSRDSGLVSLRTHQSGHPKGIPTQMRRFTRVCPPSTALPPRKKEEQSAGSCWILSGLLLALLLLPGCQALNPLCGSARPAPSIGSLSVTTITFAEVQQGFLLSVKGNNFVSSSVVVINGTTVSTTVKSSQQLQVTITTALIAGPGNASVTVNTPSGNSGDLGCTSGGTSSALQLTIT